MNLLDMQHVTLLSDILNLDAFDIHIHSEVTHTFSTLTLHILLRKHGCQLF